MFYTVKTTPEMMAHQVCTKIILGGYEISIAMEQGGIEYLFSKNSIAVFRNSTSKSPGKNMTRELFGRMYIADGYLSENGEEILAPTSITLLQVLSEVKNHAMREAGL